MWCNVFFFSTEGNALLFRYYRASGDCVYAHPLVERLGENLAVSVLENVVIFVMMHMHM